MDYTVGQNPCPACRKKGRDRSGNNFHFYGEGRGGHCFACGYTLLSDEEKVRKGLTKEFEIDEEEVSTRNPITEEETARVKSYTGTKGQGVRGISDETYKHYGCRFKYDEETGDVVSQYYPYFDLEQNLKGFKIRDLPKEWGMVGKVDNDTELFGQFRWRNATGKYVLITAGEIDCLSAFQMLEDYRKGRNSDFDPIPVVSSGVGESGSWKQIRKHYEWLCGFDKVIICYDNDDAGKKAIEKLAEVIPKGKMFVMKLTLKDANKYLEEGKAKQFIKLFYDAPAYTPTGVLGSSELSASMRDELDTEKVLFPPFMSEINEMTYGGISLGRIVNIGAGSGIGKTVYVNEIVYYLVFNSPHQIGVVSMELNSAQYGISMLSHHIGVKISNIQNRQERLNFINSPDVLKKERELFFREDGTNRWYLVDDRSGTIEDIKEAVEQLVISCGCKVIVLDPLQDLLDGLSIDEQALFLKWQKGMIKSHGITFININHLRKSAGNATKQNSEGAMISEESFAGSSTIFKSAALNILLVRDKMNEDPIERNTTYAFISKNRDNGVTGPCGEYYYDGDTHTLWNKKEWLKKNPQPGG